MSGNRWVWTLVLAVAAWTTLAPVGAQANVLDAGGYHGCGLNGSGVVLCWGANGSGQLGDGTTTTRRTPVAVSGLSGLTTVAVVAGSYHSCALIADGSVRCWGGNGHGQLGDGTTTTRLTATTVTGLTGLAVTALAAGDAHTCALISNGSLRCWGSNDWGKLGDGGATQQNTPVLVQLPGLIVTAVAAGHSHTCARISNGSVRCWGWNGYGQLGDGSNNSSPVPVLVAGLAGVSVTTLTADDMQTCATINNGSVRCWGKNDTGQLGDGSTVHRNAPVTVTGLSGTTTIAVSAGQSHACALSSAGALRCWGGNGYGQLGDGTTTRRLSAVAVVGLAGSVVTAFGTGDRHSCARISDGSWRCWGSNAEGQLGIGGVLQRPLPVRVSGLAGLPVTALAAGAWHSCALISGGTVRCWGRNQYGQLGDGSNSPRPTPTLVSALGGLTVTAISAGESHACARIVDGSLRCWGRNDRGQLGDGSNVDRNAPVLVGGLAGVTIVAVGVGAGHTCALDHLGVVRCWGRNDDGQLGDGTNTDRPLPVAVVGLAGTTVSTLAAGGWHNCVRLGDGRLRCWGSNYTGQLGDGTTTDRTSPVPVSGLAGLAANAITAGGYHSCARFSDGAVRCWGNNDSGQLGDNSTQTRTAPVVVSGLGGPGTSGLALGEYHSCARMTDGTLRCWGYNDAGQLGDGGTVDRGVAAPVLGLAGLNATDLAAGGSHTCARISDGSARCWGDNTHGVLGNGEAGYYATPQAVVDRVFGNDFEAE